jgi:hypothetical protein
MQNIDIIPYSLYSNMLSWVRRRVQDSKGRKYSKGGQHENIGTVGFCGSAALSVGWQRTRGQSLECNDDSVERRYHMGSGGTVVRRLTAVRRGSGRLH